MIQFEKLMFLRNILSSNIVTNNDLLVSLFKNMPDLQHFRFSKLQQYDDSNYYDDIWVTEINGHSYGHAGYEDEDEDGDEETTYNKLPKIQWTDGIESVVNYLAVGYEIGEDYQIRRKDFEDCSSEDNPDKTYLGSYLSGSKLPLSFFTNNDNKKFATYYALDHGRFGEDEEFDIFAKKGCMRDALEYARHVIKGRLPEALENFYVLEDSCKEDKPYVKEYVAEFMKTSRERKKR